MGAGKTSVGRALGQRLNWIFEDLDDRIQQAQGRTVAEIFRNSGEPAFRQAERAALEQVLEELQLGSFKVVALGGGAFIQPGTAALLKRSGVPAVFLDGPVEELWQRCCKQAGENASERPLLRSLDQFRALYESRRSGYGMASLKIDTSNRIEQAIADEIAEVLGLKKAASNKKNDLKTDDTKKNNPNRIGLKKIPLRIEQGEVE
jgi:shikimate kinase